MKSLLFSLCICFVFFAQAQNRIVFTNADSSKTITVKQKDLARLSYTGYMNQLQEAEGFVSAITDSSITLLPRKKFLQKRQAAQTILTRDITGFRRYSKFRPAAGVIYTVASLGITGAVSAIVSNANTSTALTFISAAGTQTATTAMKNAFFPSRIKNHLAKGWTMRLMQDQLPAANSN